MAEYEYLWAPGTSGDWIPFDEFLSILAAWNGVEPEYGLPSVTISKRVKSEQQPTDDPRGPRCGDMTLLCTDQGNYQYTCDRDPGHFGPHRDRQQKGTETISWSRTRPTR